MWALENPTHCVKPEQPRWRIMRKANSTAAQGCSTGWGSNRPANIFKEVSLRSGRLHTLSRQTWEDPCYLFTLGWPWDPVKAESTHQERLVNCLNIEWTSAHTQTTSINGRGLTGPRCFKQNFWPTSLTTRLCWSSDDTMGTRLKDKNKD